jgi:hypothetical protein
LSSGELDERFRRDGYVVIEGFCAPDQVAALIDAYEEHGPAPGDVGSYCHFDFQSADQAYKRATDAAIRAALAEPLDRWFVGYRPYYGNYVMKWPSPTSWFGVHQDSCFVDETTAVSASIWVATTEVDERNGAVWFFPGSHRMRSTVRGSNQEAYSFQDVGASIEARCGRIVRLQPGDAIVFDHRVVHWSYANTSSAPRLAAVLGVIPDEATLIHHHATSGGAEVETFAIDDEFFIVNDPFGSLLDGLQGYPSLGRSALVVEPVTEDELDRWLEAHPVDADVELAAELRAAAAAVASDAVARATDHGGQGAPGPAPSIGSHEVAAPGREGAADPPPDVASSGGPVTVEPVAGHRGVPPAGPAPVALRPADRARRLARKVAGSLRSIGRNGGARGPRP